jgi:NAD(P)-dependent dehydrogenase (short-subunit alcohol dehydrogenase family)
MGGDAVAVVADATVFDQVNAVAVRAIQVFGRLDTWVHAAAVNLYATFEQIALNKKVRAKVLQVFLSRG